MDTLSEMMTAISTEETAVDTAAQALTHQQTMYRTALANAGSDLQRDALREQYEPALTRAEREAGMAADQAMATVRRALDLAGTVNEPALPAEHQATAANLREFIREDAASLPLSDLVTRVRTAVAMGDQPRQWLYHRYLRSRLSALTDVEQMDAEESINELYRLRGRIGESLRDKRMEPLVPRANALSAKASPLRSKARARRDAERLASASFLPVGAVRVPAGVGE
jgi:hypothetical protein